MNEELFEELLESIRESKAISRGEIEPAERFCVDTSGIRTLRKKQYKLSQKEFASLLGISVDTLQNWEQGRRKPEGPARVLLQVAAMHPEAVLEAAGLAPERYRELAV